nr:MAG TPA: hypothetical protein [Caudoviricetes sp.]
MILFLCFLLNSSIHHVPFYNLYIFYHSILQYINKQ